MTNALLLSDLQARPADAEVVYQWLDALLAGCPEEVPVARLEALVASTRAEPAEGR